ncbi:MAG: hypothetical protein NC336_09745, partial [Clostridium sp.]|nr:hypothetical protein [Clostridium sp.]
HRPGGAAPRIPSLTAKGQGTTQAAAGNSGAPAPASPAVTSGRREPFTADQLDTAWTSYIASHPRDHALVNTMRVHRPKLVEANRFVVMVDSSIQVSALNDSAPDILSMLRDTLHNDLVTFSVEENVGAPSPRTWTEREVFQHMKENHPILQQFIDEFRLTLI